MKEKMGGDAAADMPAELVPDILSWLPVKALMRFRCVSKSWNSLIFDPTLVKLHLQRSSRDTPVLFTVSNEVTDEPCSLHSCSIDRLLEDLSSTVDVDHDGGVPTSMKYSVVGVCNGLICLRDTSRGFDVVQVHVWNPATRLISGNLPPINASYGNVRIMGFGYNDSSNTYKVVATAGDRKTRKIGLRVHCLGDNYWRKIPSGDDIPSILQAKGQSVSGTLNWIAARADAINVIHQLVIFSFDIRKETYGFLSLLPVHGEFGLPEVGVLKGCLSLSHNDGGTHLAVWQMKEFGVQESWTMLMKVSYSHFEFCLFYFPEPLCLSAKGDVLLLGNNLMYQPVLYDVANNRIRVSKVRGKRVVFISFDYVPSLVFPFTDWALM